MDQRGSKFFTYKVGGYRDLGGLDQLIQMGRAQDLSAFHFPSLDGRESKGGWSFPSDFPQFKEERDEYFR